ncbi:MAG TPA: ATP-binding protein [Anaerolineae bacterium]|nr:ATP-binding protein [Anaerolineae bacterium]
MTKFNPLRSTESIRESRRGFVVPDAEELADFLRQTALFRGVDKGVAVELAGHCLFFPIKKNRMIIKQGAHDESVYLVYKGKLHVTHKNDEGGDVLLETRGRGQYVGEVSLFAHHPRNANVYAEKGSQLVALSKQAFYEVMTHYPEALWGLAQAITERLHTSQMQQAAQIKALESINKSLSTANEQLKELGQLKSDFIGVITHEMRTPLASLAFSVQLLEKYGFGQWPKGQVQEFDLLRQHVAQAQRMTNNLVSFATFLSKQGALHLAATDVAYLVEETLIPLRRFAERKRLFFELDIATDMPRMLLDNDKIRDAVHHLVDNAIKFSEDGGRIRLRCWCEEDKLQFRIEDEGQGIPPEKLVHIWDGFSQMADPLTRGVEGLGLGLALVEYVVESHGGEVWADSDGESGSLFQFAIPVRLAEGFI